MDLQQQSRPIKHDGFTLVELLIATSILMVVLGTAMYGYQLYQKQWQRNLSHIQQNYQQLRRFELVSSALHGIVPYMVRHKDGHSFYFLGREEGFTAVTTNPVFKPGFPAVIRVFREHNPDGSYRLVYEEASLSEAPLITPEQQLPFTHRLVVIEQEKSLTFSYYTQPDLLGSIELSDDGESAQIIYKWLTEHDALTAKTHPQRIIINISGFVWQLQVADRSRTLFNRASRELEAL